VLDEIEANVGKIRLDSVRAVDSQFRPSGAAKDLFSSERGTSLDKARQAVEESGVMFESDSHFLDTIHRASEQRKSWRENFYAEERAVQAADKALTLEQRLDAMKVETRGTLQAFGLIPEAWNTLIDLAKLGVKAGKSTKAAVEWAVREFKRRNPKMTWDEKPATAFLTRTLDEPIRQMGEKVLVSPDIPGEVKSRISDYNYEKLPNDQLQMFVTDLVQERGIEAAMALWRDRQAGLSDAQRSALGNAVMRKLSVETASAQSSKNAERIERAVEMQAQFIDEHMARSTEVAQALQAYKILGLGRPEGIVRYARKVIKKEKGVAGQHPFRTAHAL
jgi:hypothetical protein